MRLVPVHLCMCMAEWQPHNKRTPWRRNSCLGTCGRSAGTSSVGGIRAVARLRPPGARKSSRTRYFAWAKLSQFRYTTCSCRCHPPTLLSLLLRNWRRWRLRRLVASILAALRTRALLAAAPGAGAYAGGRGGGCTWISRVGVLACVVQRERAHASSTHTLGSGPRPGLLVLGGRVAAARHAP